MKNDYSLLMFYLYTVESLGSVQIFQSITLSFPKQIDTHVIAVGNSLCYKGVLKPTFMNDVKLSTILWICVYQMSLL